MQKPKKNKHLVCFRVQILLTFDWNYAAHYLKVSNAAKKQQIASTYRKRGANNAHLKFMNTKSGQEDKKQHSNNNNSTRTLISGQE